MDMFRKQLRGYDYFPGRNPSWVDEQARVWLPDECFSKVKPVINFSCIAPIMGPEVASKWSHTCVGLLAPCVFSAEDASFLITNQELQKTELRKGHVNGMEFLHHAMLFTAHDARSHYNCAIRWAAENIFA